MRRIGWLATLAAALAAAPALAQFGGGGGGFGFPEQEDVEPHRVEVEAAGGKRLRGPLLLGPIAVESDFGRYEIKPEKVRLIRLEPDPDQPPVVSGVMTGGMGGMGGMGSQRMFVMVPGVVVTASGEEIGGTLAIPQDWTITTDLGTVTLDPSKLRSITFLDEPGEEPPAPAEGGLGRRADAPRTMRMGSTLWAFSPWGHKVVVKVAEEAEAKTLELPASEEAPLMVLPVVNTGIAALLLEGPKIARIAVFSFTDADWHTQDLREPVEGRASPVVGANGAMYHLGRFVYAFSAKANRWGVLELPEGVSARPVLNGGSVVVEYDGHVHTFPLETGEWTHTDVRGLLDDAGAGDEEGAGPSR